MTHTVSRALLLLATLGIGLGLPRGSHAQEPKSPPVVLNSELDHSTRLQVELYANLYFINSGAWKFSEPDKKEIETFKGKVKTFTFNPNSKPNEQFSVESKNFFERLFTKEQNLTVSIAKFFEPIKTQEEYNERQTRLQKEIFGPIEHNLSHIFGENSQGRYKTALREISIKSLNSENPFQTFQQNIKAVLDKLAPEVQTLEPLPGLDALPPMPDPVVGGALPAQVPPTEEGKRDEI